MVTSLQPVVSIAGNGPSLSLVGNGPNLSLVSSGPAGAVYSVNGQTGQVLVLGPVVNDLTDQAVLTPNLAVAGHFVVTLGGNRQLGVPANALVNRQRWVLEVWQDGVGGRTLSYASIFAFGTLLSAPVLSTTPSARDYLSFIWNPTSLTHDCVGFVKGYTEIL